MDYWTGLARTLEEALFDGIFLADVVGVYDVYGGSADAAVRGGVQVPVNDPMMLIPAMAAATRHLGFGVTANLLYEAPYLFARRMSTLDHLTRGRVGWNIVTGYLDSAARAAGFAQQPAHDDRYDLADEYMQLVYQLWQHSWDDGAVLADRSAGVYADPARVRAIHHHGKQYRVDAMHLC
ncbi:MAG: N5,N10-methylene tetrahydromethanopterin reductase, partial [Burkholderiales bacterium PBB5]